MLFITCCYITLVLFLTLSGSNLKVRRGSEPALNTLGDDIKQNGDIKKPESDYQVSRTKEDARVGKDGWINKHIHFHLAELNLLYASSHRQDSTYHSFSLPIVKHWL